MIDQLISDGQKLKAKAKPSAMGGDMLSGVEFETWAAKTIFFLEKHFSNSAMTAKAIEANKTLNKSSYSKYEFLLGTLIAAKDLLIEEEKEAEATARLIDELNS